MDHHPKSKLIVFYVLISLIVLLIFVWGYVYFHLPHCDHVQFLNVSVKVKSGVLGFNTDKDSLNFGAASPTGAVKRSVVVTYPQAAEVIVTPLGEIAPWLVGEPVEFELKPKDTQEVFFTVSIPQNASEREYVGLVRFCFREK